MVSRLNLCCKLTGALEPAIGTRSRTCAVWPFWRVAILRRAIRRLWAARPALAGDGAGVEPAGRLGGAGLVPVGTSVGPQPGSLP